MAPSQPLPPRQVAPSYSVPSACVASVEHPCIVQNVDKAISMLGGGREISSALKSSSKSTIDTTQSEGIRPIALHFQPGNPDSRPILSSTGPAQNLLLKITIPKRTGRRRKRGTNDPFEPIPNPNTKTSTTIDHSTNADPNPQTASTTTNPDTSPAKPAPKKDTTHLLNSLRSAPSTRVKISVVAKITSTHLYREMPDLVFSSTTQSSPFLNGVQTHLTSTHYPSLKSFSTTFGQTGDAAPHTDSSQKETVTEMIPPPVFSAQALPTQITFGQQVDQKRSGLAMGKQYARIDAQSPSETGPAEHEDNPDGAVEMNHVEETPR